MQLADGSHVMVSAEVKNAGRDVEVNAINTVFGRSVISDVHEKLVYVGNELTPEQQALLNGTTPHQYPDARGQDEEGVPSSDGKDSVSSDNGQGNVGENVTEMPMRRVKRKIEGQVMEVDEEDFEAVSPERTQDYLYNEVESGITREQADDFVSAKIAEREKVVKGIEARKPRKGASPAEIRVHKGKVAAELAEAVPGLEYWRAVAAARDAVKEREIAAANERYRQERAAKEEAKRAAEVQRKEDVETLQNAEQGDNRTSSRMAIPASSDGKVNTSSNSKQGNVNESKGKAQKAFSYFNGSMEELIGKSSDKTANDKKVVSVVSEQLRNDLSAQGLEIGEDYKHVVDVSGIRHTMKQHGHIKEKKRGQVPIEAKDFALIENVVSSYDDVVVEQKKSTPIIKYKKRLDDGTIVYVEEVRMGRGELALKTMYKQKGSSLTDENLQMPVSDTPVATSDLDASDGKVSTSSEKGKRKAQKKTSNGDKPAFVGLDAFTEQRMAEELEKSGYASLEDWEIEEPDAFVTVYDNVGKEYASYVSRLAEEGTLQEVYDKSSVKTQNKIRKEIEFAGFDYHDLLDTSPNRVKRQDYLEGGAKYARGTFLDGRVVEGEIVEQSPTSITILENGRRYTIKASDVLVRSNEPLSSDESLSAKIAAAEGEVDTNPSEGQKEAGNYKKGHIRIGAFDISIEQPKGSVRRGVDANGKAWESKMHNTYGYFRGTEGVDGDHIDVFVSNDIDGWNGQKVFVVDQYNPDGTFDEHKVMLGFNDAQEAMSDYLANYEKGWEDGRRLDVSATNLEDFEKWLASSHRKTKPFAEYKGVKREVDEVDAALKKELQDFIAQTDTMDRTAMDESGYDAKELFAPLLLDGKPSPLAVMTSVSDDINDPSVQIAVYDYSQEIDEKTNSGWQKWGNLADEYNAQAAEEDKGWERGDTALLGFRSVDAAVRFYDWVQHRDGVKLHRKGATDAALHAVDDQGNLVDGEGRLVTEKVGSIDELRDEDFTSPSRSVELPELDARVADAIGTGGKPVVIKKNIFERNAKAHGDLTAADSRDILKAALYTPTLYGQNQKTKRPYNWVLIKTRDAEGENRVVLLEVNENKDNVEIVHWHYLDNRGIEKIKRQAVREDGHLLILPSEDSEEAGALSSRTNNLSSEGKVSESSKKEQGEVEKKKRGRGKIDDFGEKIGGARKDKARERILALQGMSDADLRRLGVEGVLSQKEIVKAVGDGRMSQEDGVVLSAAYRVSEFLVKYRGGDVFYAPEVYRQLATQWANGEALDVEGTREKFSKVMPQKSFYKNAFESYVEMYKSLNFPTLQYTRMGSALVAPYGRDDKYWYLSKLSARSGNVFSSRDEALSYFLERHLVVDGSASKEKTKKRGLGGLSVTRSWPHKIKSRYIPGDVNVVDVLFTSKSEAEEYLSEHLEELLEEEKRLERELMGRHVGARVRVGKDWRGGRDASEEDFLDFFGFRGVEFGNWVNQSERLRYMNHAYDGFMDLSALLGVSPRSLSLGGTLGLAFGARGGGKASAHYERSLKVINLTRTNGAGALAHEWFHALDNFLHSSVSGDSLSYASDDTSGLRNELRVAFDALLDKMNELDYSQRSKRAGDYWGSRIERMARAFEDYVESRLQEDGVTSSILTRENAGAKLDAVQGTSYPLLSVEERAVLHPYFDALFEVMQEREDEGGRRILYHKHDDGVAARDAAYADAVARGDMETAERMLAEEAARKGYIVESDYQGTSAFNGAAPSENGYYESLEGRKAAFDEEDFEGDWSLADELVHGIKMGSLDFRLSDRELNRADRLHREVIQNLRNVRARVNAGEKDVRITMYRSVPAGVVEGEFRNGDWVTPGRLYAEDNAAVHGGYPGWENGYCIIEQEVPIEHVWWDGNDVAEWGYDNGREEVYKNVANNRKSFSVTYDADGVLIPLSKRFDEGVSDVSYHKGDDVVVSAEDAELRDAVVELMRGAGIDVVVDSEEGQRVLDMENGGVRWAMGERKTFRSGRSIVFTRANPTATLNALERGLKKEGVEVESHKARTGSRYAEFERGGVWYKVRSANHTKALSAGTTLDEVRGMSGIELTMDLKDKERPMYGVEVDLSLNEMGVAGLRALMDEVERFNGSGVDVLSEERVAGFVLPSSYLGDEFPLLSGFLDDEVLRSDEFKGRLKEAQAEVGAVREAYERDTEKPVLDEKLRLPFTASNGLKIEHLADGFGRYVSLMPAGSALSHGIGRFGDAKKLRKEAFAEYKAAVAPYEARLMAWEESAPSLEEWLKGNEEMSGRWASAQEVLSRAVGGARLHKVGAEEDAEGVNARFNDELGRYERGEMGENEMFHLGMPEGVMRGFLPELPIVMRQRVVRKASEKKHDVEVSALRDMPKMLAEPIFVFQRDGESLGVLTEMNDRKGRNVFVAFALQRNIQDGGDVFEVNDIRSIHGREHSNIIEPIKENGTLKWVDKEKGLNWLSSASSNYQQEIDSQDLSSAAKVVKDFENPKLGMEKRRFFRTEDGKAYGFTVDGKVYLDPRMAGAETAVHEYTHLWADALRRVNPAEWRNVVELMKATSVWDEVKRGYPELESEDEIADEVLAHYSGRRGAAKLRAALDVEMGKADGVFERARVVSAFERVKRALARFWKGVADFLGVHFDSADEVADMVLGDLLRGRRLGVAEKGVSMVGRSLSAEEAKELVVLMEENAAPVRELELTRENWAAEFGADGVVQTPLGEVKMGEHQYEKLEQQGRRGKLGMVKPTLESPDVIIEDKSRAKVGEETERGSSYVFVKAFTKEDGERTYYFTSVTVSRDGKEVVVSNQEKRKTGIASLSQKGKVVWMRSDNASTLSDEEQGFYNSQAEKSELATRGTVNPQTTSSAKVDKSSENDKGEDIFSMAERIAEETKREQRARRNARYHREGGSVEYGQAVSRAAYEQRMASGAFQSREALQDSMLSLREAMDLILHEGKHGKGWRVEEVSDLENAYMGENRLSSVNSAEQEAFTREMFKPMLGAVAKLAETEEERMVLTDYLMAKHGLERNRVMAEREGQKAYETYMKKHPESEREMEEFIAKARERDYAGLTALTGVEDVSGAEMEAAKMVEEFEEKG